MLEIPREDGLIVETQLVANLLDALVAARAEHHLSLGGDIMGNPVTGTHARLLLDDVAEILWRKAKQLGIVIHLAVFFVMLHDCIEELIE